MSLAPVADPARRTVAQGWAERPCRERRVGHGRRGWSGREADRRSRGSCVVRNSGPPRSRLSQRAGRPTGRPAVAPGTALAARPATSGRPAAPAVSSSVSETETVRATSCCCDWLPVVRAPRPAVELWRPPHRRGRPARWAVPTQADRWCSGPYRSGQPELFRLSPGTHVGSAGAAAGAQPVLSWAPGPRPKTSSRPSSEPGRAPRRRAVRVDADRSKE
jgi:hypothetical protein